MKEEPSYFYDYTRSQCEDILQNTKDGTFLIRRSESNREHYVLVVNWEGRAHHFKILNRENKFHLQAAEEANHIYFACLDDLVCYYKKNKMTATNDQYILGQPLSEGQEEDDGVDDDDMDVEWDLDPGEEDNTTPFFQQQLKTIKSARNDEQFMQLLMHYVDNDVIKDFQCVSQGKCRAPFAQQLVVNAATDLQQSLEKYLSRLDVLHKLFDFGSNTKNVTADQKEKENPHDIDAILKMLRTCKESMQGLEKKALNVFSEIQNNGRSSEAVENLQQETDPYIPIESLKCGEPAQVATKEQESDYAIVEAPERQKKPEFEVTTGTLKSKSVIKIDVVKGEVLILKVGSDKPEIYAVDQILELTKSKSAKNLKVKFLNNNQDVFTKNICFSDYASRELFCQTVQQVKIVHSSDPTSSELTLFVGTWNMATSNVPEDISSWYKSIGSGKTCNSVQQYGHIASDLFVFGTQESAYYEKEWTSRLIADLEKTYNRKFRQVVSSTLWGIRMVILIKAELWPQVNSIKQSSVKTGIANALGNKGAVGVSFNIGTTSFCFVNSHLTSGTEKLKRRNQNYQDILRGLSLGQTDGFDITLAFHHVFWLGDLNYRLELEEKDIPMIIRMRMMEEFQHLLDHDQLTNEKSAKNAFIEFNEADMQFPPTYKYKKGDRLVYDWRKEKRTEIRINVPSWCDRVLWRSYPEVPSCNLTYGCTDNIYTSDHSPVFSTFKIGKVDPNTTSIENKTYKENDMVLTFKEVSAKITTRSACKFILTFNSNCFEKQIGSQLNSIDSSKRQQESLMRRSGTNDTTKHHSYPWWTKGDIPTLNPVLKDPYYLETQHLLIAVKGEDQQESYGECVISLKPFLNGKEQSFHCLLTHLGLETGSLQFVATMSIPQNLSKSYQPSIKNEIYSLIKIEDDDSISGKGDSLGKRSKTMDGNTHYKEQKVLSGPTASLSKHPDVQQVEPEEKIIDKQMSTPPMTRSNNTSNNNNNNKRVSIGDFLKRQSLGFDNPSMSPLTPPPPQQQTRTGGNVGSLSSSTPSANAPPPVVSRKASVPPPPPKADTVGVDDDDDEIPPAPPKRIHSIERSFSEQYDSSADMMSSSSTSSSDPHGNSLVPELPPKRRVTPSNSSSDDVNSNVPTVSSQGKSLERKSSTGPDQSPKPKPRTKRKAHEIRVWLESIKCQQYFDKLISNGYDDINFYHELDIEDLTEIGVNNDADRVKIIMNAKSLQMRPSKGLFKV